MIIIILGAGIDEKGRLPKETAKRIKEGLKVYQEKKAPFLLSGKYSFAHNKEKPPKITEAEVMKDYLLNLGVEEKHILLDKESEDTILSAYNAKTKFLIPREEKEVVIITSDINMERVEYVFYKVLGKDYKLHFVGTISAIPCQTKGMIRAKQRALTEKAVSLLDNIEEGDHEKIKEKVMSPDYKNNTGLRPSSNLNYKKTC